MATLFIVKSLRRCGYGIERRPAPVKPSCDGSKRDSIGFYPFDNQFTLAVYCKHSIGRLVSVLLLRCGPTAIRKLIVAVYFNAVKGMFVGRRLSHISKESVKGGPSFANFDTPSAIIRILGVTRIAAAIVHLLPDCIDARLSHPVSLAANPLQASTGLSATSQIYRGYVSHLPARTLATPKQGGVLGVLRCYVVAHGLKRGQKAEVLTAKIVREFVQFVWELFGCKVNIRHQVSPFAELVVRGQWTLPRLLASFRLIIA
jgi:hypothetical protein